jgi:demethoxyubiquinone hydroxylase (CLK1/Coq7/Cat5 family)
MVAILRTDHAGETGAICITTGCCAFQDKELRDFAQLTSGH